MGALGISAGVLGGFALGGMIGPALTGKAEQSWSYGALGAWVGAVGAHLLLR